MKLLILQLARLGDIYQTWPVVYALKRANPELEIHVLSRTRFRDAWVGHPCVTKIWNFDTREIIKSLLNDQFDPTESLQKLEGLTDQLVSEGFDEVLNLSFSPASATLTSLLQRKLGADVVVKGYSRHSDGTLDLPDDSSRYFYAQVGPTRANRLNLSWIFSQVAGVDLCADDWQAPLGLTGFNTELASIVPEDFRKSIVLHLSASNLDKCLPPSKWQRVVAQLLRESDRTLILIGSEDERTISQQVWAALPETVVQGRVLDLTGKTKIQDLFAILHGAPLLIGADSSPVHVAALVGTPVLNLSFATVNFWETGPKSPHSRIFWQAKPETMTAEAITVEAMRILQSQPARYSRAESDPSPLELYHELVGVEDPEWEMIQAIYLGGQFPDLRDENRDRVFLHSMQRLDETNELAIQQLEQAMRDYQNNLKPESESSHLLILDRCDQIFRVIGSMSPEVDVILRWFAAERIHLGPDLILGMVKAQLELHRRLEQIIRVYRPRIFESALVKEHGNDSIILE